MTNYKFKILESTNLEVLLCWWVGINFNLSILFCNVYLIKFLVISGQELQQCTTLCCVALLEIGPLLDVAFSYTLMARNTSLKMLTDKCSYEVCFLKIFKYYHL